jgi:hypothetical protein
MEDQVTAAESGDPLERFSLVAGGPFHALLRRLRLTGPDQLPTPYAALLLALLAWLPPALLALAQSVVEGRSASWDYFTDLTVLARYLVAIWVMVAMERFADGRVALLVRQFEEAELIADDGRNAYTAAVALADRRSRSALAELLILIAALAWSGVTADYAVALSGSSWEGTAVAGEVVLSWAGEAARFVSNPLFLFLVLRWIWRFLVWTELLFRISRLPLRLSPMHPDHAAGLGFLAIFPSIFSGFVFALSCVIASSMLKELDLTTHTAETVWLALATWIGICMVLVLGPLLVFVGPLHAARERALLDYGRLASQHHQAFHRKWIGEAQSGENMLGCPDPSSATDLNSSVQAVRDMRFFPIDVPAVAQLFLAAGLPLLAVVLREVPLADILQWVVGTIL